MEGIAKVSVLPWFGATIRLLKAERGKIMPHSPLLPTTRHPWKSAYPYPWDKRIRMPLLRRKSPGNEVGSREEGTRKGSPEGHPCLHPWLSREFFIPSRASGSCWQLSMSEDVNNDSSSSKVDEKKIVVEFCQLQEKSRQLFNALRFFTYIYCYLYYFLHGMSLLEPVRPWDKPNSWFWRKECAILNSTRPLLHAKISCATSHLQWLHCEHT